MLRNHLLASVLMEAGTGTTRPALGASSARTRLADSTAASNPALHARRTENLRPARGRGGVALGVAVYVALWQNKGFEVATVAFNEATDAPTATTKINGRIH